MKFLKTLFLLLASLAASAQSIHPKLDSVLQKTLHDQRNSLNARGLSAALQLPGGAVWAGGSGTSTTTPNVPIDSAHVFGIGSVTKTVTAACILQMADEGLLSLDDSLHRWLDTFPHISPNITVRQLLRHQSGIYDVVTAPTFQNVLFADQDSIWQLADVVKTFIAAPTFQPGSGWRYSNTNYLLLGMIIEKVDGKPYYQSFRDRFLAPLGLETFAMLPFEPQQGAVAHPWLDLNGDGVLDDAHTLFANWHSFDAATGPAGSYYCKASDLARWVGAFVGGNVLSDDMLAQAKATVSTSFPNGTRYGLGLMQRTFLTHTAFGHGGDSGYSATAWHFPDLGLSISVLNNDGRRNSWQLGPVVQALLKAYLDCQILLDAPDVLAENAPAMQVVPNPFSSEIHLKCQLAAEEGEATWALTNQLGQSIANGPLAQAPDGAATARLANLEKLPPGLYFLQCLVRGKVASVERVSKNGNDGF